MKRNYDTYRFSAMLRNELNSRADILESSNDKGERYQNRLRNIRQGNDSSHRGVKHQHGEGQSAVTQPSGKRFRGKGADYAEFIESNMHNMRLDGENYHSHQQYKTFRRSRDSPPICIFGASYCIKTSYALECTALK